MLIQLSSNNGPIECERAVVLLTETLKREVELFENNFKILNVISGDNMSDDGAALVLIETDCEILEGISGTVRWCYTSPYRSSTSGRNEWDVSCIVIPNVRKLKVDSNSLSYEIVHRTICRHDGSRYQQFGIRVVHMPTGLFAECYENESSKLSREDAFSCLADLLVRMEEQARAGMPLLGVQRVHNDDDTPIRVYRGVKFRRVS